jgi:hypothetical protein
MTTLPEGFRVLQGTDLLRAQALRERYIQGLVPLVKDGRTAGINDVARVIEAESSIETDNHHLAALRDAAGVVGDSTAWIVTDVFDPPEVACLEVELAALCEFAKNTDFRADGDSWVPEAMKDWPELAAKVAYPEFSKHWTLLSPTEHWGYVNTDDGELKLLAGSAPFIRAYRASRPLAPYDILIWLHNGAYDLIEKPKMKWNWFKPRVPEGPPTRTKFLGRYLESIYGRGDAEWIWELYSATFVEGCSQGPVQGWKKFQEALIDRVNSDPTTEGRLLKIWDESRPS